MHTFVPCPTQHGALCPFLTSRGLGALRVPVPSELNMSSAQPALWKHTTRTLQAAKEALVGSSSYEQHES